MTLKRLEEVSVSVRYLFSQSMDEKIKYGLFVFPPKKTLIWRTGIVRLANRVAVWRQSKVSIDF